MMMTIILGLKIMDEFQVAEETSHLAPHGVPSNPIPRALSSNRLHDLAQQEPPGYNANYGTTGGNLDIPGAGMGGGSFNFNGYFFFNIPYNKENI